MPRNPFYQGSMGSVFNAAAAVPSAKEFFVGALGEAAGAGISRVFAKPDPLRAAQADLATAQADKARYEVETGRGADARRAEGRTSMGAALAEAAEAYARAAGGAVTPPAAPPSAPASAGAAVTQPPRPAKVAPDGVTEVEGVDVTAARAPAPAPDPQKTVQILFPSMVKIAKAFATGDFTADELKAAQSGMGALFSMMPGMDDSIARMNSAQGKYLGDTESVSVAGQTNQREDRQVQETSVNDADNKTNREIAAGNNAASRYGADRSAGATVSAAQINQAGAMDRERFGAANPKPGSVDPGDVAGLLPPGLDPALGNEVKRRAYDLAAQGMNPAQAVDKAISELTEEKKGWFGGSKTVRRSAPAKPAAPGDLSDDEIKRQLGL